MQAWMVRTKCKRTLEYPHKCQMIVAKIDVQIISDFQADFCPDGPSGIGWALILSGLYKQASKKLKKAIFSRSPLQNRRRGEKHCLKHVSSKKYTRGAMVLCLLRHSYFRPLRFPLSEQNHRVIKQYKSRSLSLRLYEDWDTWSMSGLLSRPSICRTSYVRITPPGNQRLGRSFCPHF